MEEVERVYIFNYGYNSPGQVARLVGVPVAEILSTAIPCTLRGYRRVFAGIADDFGDKSVATIVQDETSEIQSYAFSLNADCMKYIDEFEEYPKMYDRIQVDLEKVSGETFQAYVYVMNDITHFGYPTEEYLQGVAQTISAFYYLQNLQFDYCNVSMDIIKADNLEKMGTETVKVSVEAYPAEVQDVISKLVDSSHSLS
ncbi:unnamed protein product [Moneuplotes crassus]|uniref:Gamma-glutamylcyclotransferase AIG2-like domain-containing protein n=1 Tax=Euplotes crassus TaxID=5936 RepID=A0AAD1Y1M2_EUPCR|nr:unnamed protein product [Moneuplotes crassus]